MVAELIRTTTSHLTLEPSVEVDVQMFVAQARRLIGPGEDFDHADASPDLLVGDLLPDWDEDWILFERERLRQLRVHALESLCRRLSRGGRHAEAIDAGQAAVAAEPLRESAQRALILAHLSEGNMCEGRRQFELYRSLLWDSLELSPAADLFELTGARQRALASTGLFSTGGSGPQPR
jgi:DNA-binding SARP family transcriptional activator